MSSGIPWLRWASTPLQQATAPMTQPSPLPNPCGHCRNSRTRSHLDLPPLHAHGGSGSRVDAVTHRTRRTPLFGTVVMHRKRSIRQYARIVLPPEIAVRIPVKSQALGTMRAAQLPHDVATRLVHPNDGIQVAKRNDEAISVRFDGVHMVRIGRDQLLDVLLPPLWIGFRYGDVIHRRPVPDKRVVRRDLLDHIIHDNAGRAASIGAEIHRPPWDIRYDDDVSVRELPEFMEIEPSAAHILHSHRAHQGSIELMLLGVVGEVPGDIPVG